MANTKNKLQFPEDIEDDDDKDPFSEDSEDISKETADIKSIEQVLQENPVLANLGNRLRKAESKGDIVEQQLILNELISSVLVEKEDYGKIPNIPKPTLLKGGAEKIAAVYNLSADFTIIGREVDWNATKTIINKYDSSKNKTVVGLISYDFKCDLKNRETGRFEGSGVGGGNSFEKKFASQGDGHDTHNTVIKMTKKRSFVDAVLSRSCISGKFTQDVEDMDLSESKSYPSASSSSVKKEPVETVKETSNSTNNVAEAPWPTGKPINFDLKDYPCKGKPISQCSVEALKAYLAVAEHNITQDKYVALNKGFVKAVKAELQTR